MLCGTATLAGRDFSAPYCGQPVLYYEIFQDTLPCLGLADTKRPRPETPEPCFGYAA
jgi:hypothetical protein